MEKHRHFSPDCPFVVHPNSSGNIPINMKPTTGNIDSNSGIHPGTDLLDEASRLATFEKWPVS